MKKETPFQLLSMAAAIKQASENLGRQTIRIEQIATKKRSFHSMLASQGYDTHPQNYRQMHTQEARTRNIRRSYHPRGV